MTKNKNIKDIQTEELAREFSRLLLAYIGLEDMETVNYLHDLDGPESGICHTHDYCDANQIMIDAIQNIIGGEYGFDLDDCNCLNQAWNMARRNEFYIND